jgi:phospholipid/cholesterol/gamma-HCH transport system substrate-binding protein
LVAVVLAAAALVVLQGAGTSQRTVTAVFDEAVNVHPGDEVRILGVKVGRVESVEPSADRVVVELSYDDEYQLSAEATAAVVTPTLVSVRYIQLGPLAGKDGDVLADAAEIPLERTASPLEWDRIKDELDQLVTALGPDGGAQPSLERLLTTAAANLDGQGLSLRSSITELAGAFDTLSRGGDDLFSVVRNLATFVKALAANDAQVATFNDRIATVSGILSDNRTNLSALLRTLDANAAHIARFLRDNKEAISDTVTDLGSITTNIARSRQALADVLQRTPIAASNLHNIYDPFSGALTTSVAATNFNDPAQFLCGVAMGAAPAGPGSDQGRSFCQTALGPLLDLVRLPNLPVGVNPIEREGQ